MKYSILGFNQEKITQTTLDLTDLLLLQYIIQANGNPDMKHIIRDEVSYVWLSHNKILSDLPILRISEGTLRNRIVNLKKEGWIISATVKLSTGTRTYYSVSLKATSLINDVGSENEEPRHEKMTCPRHEKMTSDNKLIDNKLNNSNSTKVELEQPTVTQSNTPKRLVTVVPATLPIKEKKKNLYEKCQDKIDDFTKDENIKELLTTYLKVRLEIKDYPLYANQWTGYINELKRLVESGQDMREVIQQSINRGYRGFFPVKKYNKQSNGQDPVVFSEYGIVKSMPAEGEAMHVQF